MTQMTVTTDGKGTRDRRWLGLFAVLTAMIMNILDSTIVNVAAPSIRRDLGGSYASLQWVVAAYTLALGVGLFTGGRLGDMYGRKRVLLTGAAGFVAASLACAFAVTPGMLIGSRVLQGLFGAVMVPQAFGLIRDLFPPKEIGKAFGALGPVIGLSTIAGPIVAGLLIDADIAGLGWRPVFLINIVLGSASLIAAARILPADGPGDPAPIDGVGAGLLGAAMFGLMYGLIAGSTGGWTVGPVSAMVAGTAFLAGFAVRQRVAPDPLIRPSLLRNRGFTSGLLLGLAYFAAVNGLAFVISLFLQTALRFSPSHASLALAPMMTGIIVASFVARPLISKLGRTLVVWGLVLTIAGAAGLFATVLAGGTATSAWLMAPSILVLGLGMGACFASIYDVAIGDVAGPEAGSASGSLSAVQQLASAIGSAVVTTVYFGQRAAHGAGHAMAVSVAVVSVITALGLGLVWLMPRRAPAEEW